MKVVLIILFFSINIYCQNSSVNCDSIIFSKKGMADVWFEKMPELIGGLDSLQSKLVYPQEAIENNIEGKIYVVVVIDSMGNQ